MANTCLILDTGVDLGPYVRTPYGYSLIFLPLDPGLDLLQNTQSQVLCQISLVQAPVLMHECHGGMCSTAESIGPGPLFPALEARRRDTRPVAAFLRQSVSQFTRSSYGAARIADAQELKV